MQLEDSCLDERFGGYRNWLLERCGQVEVSGFETYDVFVPPPAREFGRSFGGNSSPLSRDNGVVEDYFDSAGTSRSWDPNELDAEISILELLGRERRVAVVGESGSGKTSLLKYLAVRWAIEGSGPVPIWIDLAERPERPFNLPDFLRTIHPGFGLDTGMTNELLSAGKAAIYLDGLDRIADLRFRRSTLDGIAAFSRRYPLAPIVVASRRAGYEPETLYISGFVHVVLKDFEEPQALAYFQKRYHADVQAAERIQRGMEQFRIVENLARSPRFLATLAEISAEETLGNDRRGLCREIARALIRGWCAGNRVLRESNLAVTQIENFLKLAAGAISGGHLGIGIETEELRRIVDECMEEAGVPEENSNRSAVAHELTDNNPFLSFRGPNRAAFADGRLFDYFCAVRLLEIGPAAFEECWRDERWHGALSLYAGFGTDAEAERLIQYLLSCDGRFHRLANLILAARCLGLVRDRSAISETDEAVRNRLLCDAIHFGSGSNHSGFLTSREEITVTTKAVGLIASLWRNAGARDWVISVARTNRDWIVRGAAMRKLAKGWGDERETVEVLLERVKFDDMFEVRFLGINLAAKWKEDSRVLPFLQSIACSHGDSIMRSDSVVRMVAIRAIGREWAHSIETILWLKGRALADADEQVRIQALCEVARLGREDSATPLWLKERAESDERISVRRAAMEELVLGWSEDPEISTFLFDKAFQDNDRWLGSTILQELARGWNGDIDLFNFLRERLALERSAAARRTMLESLARRLQGLPEGASFLKHCAVRDMEPLVRCAAVQELARGWKDDPEVLIWLKECIVEGEQADVRQAGLRELALGWADDPDTLPLLLDRAEHDPHPGVRKAAIFRLAKGWPHEGEVLRVVQAHARSDKHWTVRASAISSLAEEFHDDPETFCVIHRRARSDENTSVRIRAINRLARGWLGEPRTLSLLLEISRSETEREVRRAAVRQMAWGWRDSAEVSEQLKNCAAFDKDPQVRRLAEEALDLRKRDSTAEVERFKKFWAHTHG
jgi:HEAT repeat protein